MFDDEHEFQAPPAGLPNSGALEFDDDDNDDALFSPPTPSSDFRVRLVPEFRSVSPSPSGGDRAVNFDELTSSSHDPSDDDDRLDFHVRAPAPQQQHDDDEEALFSELQRQEARAEFLSPGDGPPVHDPTTSTCFSMAGAELCYHSGELYGKWQQWRKVFMLPLQRYVVVARFLPAFRLVEWLAAVGLVTAHLICLASALLGESTWKDRAKEQGGILQFDLVALLLLNLRNTPFVPLLGVSQDLLVFWHGFIAWLFIVFSSVHGATAFVAYSSSAHDFVEHIVYDWENFAALLALACFVLLGVFSLPPVRRHAWEVFRCGHVLALPAVVLLFFHHSADTTVGVLFIWLVPYAVDLFLRFRALLRSRIFPHASITAARTVGRLLVLDVFSPSVAATARPGQWVLLTVPELGTLQQHPFSVVPSSSNSGAHDTFCLYVRSAGNWTAAAARLGADLVGSHVTLEGPYGHLSIDAADYSRLVFVSGGTGIAPHLSIIAALRRRLDGPMHITVVWSTRSFEEFEALKPLFAQQSLSFYIHWKIFYTGDESVAESHSSVDRSRFSIRRGRPDFAVELDPRTVHEQEPLQVHERIGLYLSGPSQLVFSALRAAVPLHIYDIHQDVFEL